MVKIMNVEESLKKVTEGKKKTASARYWERQHLKDRWRERR